MPPEVETGGSWFKTGPDKVNMRPYLKTQTKSRKIGGLAPVAENKRR
jgi:hypothetical protein